MPDKMKYTPRIHGPLPLMIGITGHRDLREEDRERLADQIRKIFADLQNRYPATPLFLLSPLAEGADRLAAHVALEMGMHLAVPLPMSRDEYEHDFATPESRSEFDTLLKQAERSFDLCSGAANPEAIKPKTKEGRNQLYAQVGAYIARHSQILIALWDGVDSQEQGGTANVVRFKLQGVPPPYAPPPNPLDAVESGPVYIISTPRVKNPQMASEPFQLTKQFPKGHQDDATAEKTYDRIYQRFDDFNRDTQRLGDRLAKARERSKSYVFSADQEKLLSRNIKFPLSVYSWADCLAGHFQAKTLWTVRGLLLLILLAAASFQVYTFSESKPLVLAIVYLVFFALAYALNLWARWHGYQNKHLDYRALAEGLRVHIFWRMAGLKDSVADHYLRKQHDELDWIRQALRVWSIPRRLETPAGIQHVVDVDGDDFVGVPTRLEPQAEIQPQRMEIIFKHWIQDQAQYFDKVMRRYDMGSRLIRVFQHGFFLGGLALAVIKVFLESNHPMFIAIVLMIVVAALLHFYGKFLGLAELAKQYARMRNLFRRGEECLEPCLKAGNYAKAQVLLHRLGQEALVENGDWIMLHRERPLEVPSAGGSG